MDNLLPGFNPKVIAAVLMVLCVVLELRKGYFNRLAEYLRSYSWRYSLLLLALFSAAAVAVFFFDPLFLEYLQTLGSRTAVNRIAQAGGMMGRNINPWLFFGLLYFVGVAGRRETWKYLGFGMLLSGALTAGVTTLFKFIFLRARPYGELGPFCFFNIEGLTRDERVFQSFPSGDVAIVAGAAAFLFYVAGRSMWRWVFLLLPLMTSLSRITLNKHWPSDTLFSIGLGLIFGHFIYRYAQLLRSSVQDKSGRKHPSTEMSKA
ncbi:MAG: phosphatase PAP2 family protein [Candidatus Omnitrophica bacterium]|nr:phosphatase PAP2 family protein [Candidatus Omnitrophota bacterium]MDD5671694.1 phosphatase PAP2 family protein [Candidatus Omnitrophota bacterium]